MLASSRLSLALCTLALASCSTVNPAADEGGSVVRTGLFQDFGAREPKPDATAPASTGGRQDLAAPAFAAAPDQPEGGAIRFIAQTIPDAKAGAAAAQYRLNFENADLRTVVQAILGETLHINYVMNADVTGQVTISSPRSMTAQELLFALDTVLQSNGFSMTKTGSTVRIGAATTGGGAVDTAARTSPGYGLSVVPLRHVSAGVMSQLVSGFVVDADGLRVDPARNAMIVRGPGAQREQAVQAIMSFDADWMENQSVGIYEVKRAQPEAVVSELTRIFDTQEKGVGAGTVQFKAITRLHAVMVIAKSNDLMKRAETWVRRLDRDSAAGGDNVYVYKARYRDAKELARVMSTLFQAGGDAGRGGSGSSGSDQRNGGQSGGSFGTSDERASGGGFTPASATAPVSNATAAGGAGRTGAQSSPFNNELFGDGASNSAGAEGGDTIDLTRQGAGGDRPKILISADPANNSVVTYADGYTYQKVLAALKQLDSAPLQVAINATIAEVQLTDRLKNGVEYFLKSNTVGLGKDNGSVSLFGAAANVLSKSAPGFNVLLGGNSNPDVVISALDAVTNVEILSSPSLVVAENQPANFQVGDEVPIVTRQAQSVDTVNAPLVNQIEFRDTGVILNVTPRIGQNDAVTMQIEQVISAVVDGQNTLTPTISKRRVSSNISVTSGQTVLLAGLISKRNDRSKSGIPILGDLKGIGDLFSVRGNSKDRTELVVFIRPVVIRNGEDAASVANDFRSRLSVLGAADRTKYTK